MRVFIMAAATLAVLLTFGTGALRAQSLTLSCDTMRGGEPFTIQLANGPSGAPYHLAMDRQPGPRQIPGVGTLGLALSPQLVIFPLSELDALGAASWPSFVHPDPAFSGITFHIQALCGDPSTATGYALTQTLQRTIHPGVGPVLSTEVLPILGDMALPVAFPEGMLFPFYGTTYSELGVSGNGLLTFGGLDPDPTEEVLDLLWGLPKLAVLWDDLAPESGGEIRVELGSDFIRVRWLDVPEYWIATHNTAEATLYADGRISLAWDTVGLTDGLVGLGPGEFQGTPQYPTFSSAMDGTSAGANPVAQQFFPWWQPFDLSDTRITFVPAATGGYTWYR